MPTIAIRPAAAADAPALAALRYRFRAELGEPEEDEAGFIARMAPWLAARLPGPQWRAWVAHDETGRICGHIFLQVIEKLPNPVREAEALGYVSNAYVVPERRGAGLGGRLLGEALAAGASLGLAAVFLWASEASIPFYRRHGFASHEALLERPAPEV